MNTDRYARQVSFRGIGRPGQEKLLSSRVAVVGLGALGSVIANALARAGVGYLRLIDRDYCEITNLQRQILYTEEDVRQQQPKAVAAVEHLRAVNSEIKLEPVVADFNSGNAERLLAGLDLVVDGSDNFEVRYILNEACHKLGLPWVYGGATGSAGASLNILPGGPCFRCLAPAAPPAGSYPTCSTVGALNAVTGAVANYEAGEALKILIQAEPCRDYMTLDLWTNRVHFVKISKNPSCPVCARGEYEYLGRESGAYSTTLCGQDAIQIVPAGQADCDLAALAERLRPLGEVKQSRFLLSFASAAARFKLFPDGRALIEGVTDENAAKSVYSEYIGM
ncbi:MAG: ThiF family adenylyltransferase [Gracilibacteraceae bacterium]|jgi:adenylyltransferase/sulfurtransferase|nr:ThiF family adenylyltransferase [Gracilibacteraceae bacterium]